MKSAILLIGVVSLIFFVGCKKMLGTQELILKGKITDDITNLGINGGGSIKVDGFNSNAGGLNGNDRKSNIGNGKISGDGSFTVSFSKWDPATTYEFYFSYPNNAYINNGNIYLNTLLISSNQFSTREYSMNITAAKLVELQINFRNTSPFNNNDSLKISFPSNDVHFYYLMPRWENLQNCTVGISGEVKGGVNASGTLKCNVPADRKFKLEWLTKKNGVVSSNNDSLFCQRNITTIYPLNY